MTVAAIFYSLLVATVLGGAATAVERVCAARQWPRRGVWLFALVTSAVLPAPLVYGAWHVTVSQQSPFEMPLVILRPAIWLLGMRSLIATALNAILDVAWKAATTLYLALGIWAWMRLQVVSRSWLRERVDDQEVRVSDRYGPGAYGFLRPTIVVPTWLLEIDSETRAAALIHEREHAERRDPLISAIGLLMFSIMPWNPVMGWQLRRLKLAIEMDCDTRVVRSNPRMDVSTYSNALIQLWRRGDLMRASDAMPGLKSHVKQRICAMQARLI